MITIYTEFTVKVNDVIKGDTNKDILKVVLPGGVLDGVTAKTESTELTPNSKVLLLLGTRHR